MFSRSSRGRKRLEANVWMSYQWLAFTVRSGAPGAKPSPAKARNGLTSANTSQSLRTPRIASATRWKKGFI